MAVRVSLAAFALPATAVDTLSCRRDDTDLFGLPAPVSLGEPMSSLNAANINYDSLKALEAMKRLKQLESLRPPSN